MLIHVNSYILLFIDHYFTKFVVIAATSAYEYAVNKQFAAISLFHQNQERQA